MRGVELVEPLTSVNKVMATSRDVKVFNGYCGAESGCVPVSTVAPAVLVGEIELQQVARQSEPEPDPASALVRDRTPSSAGAGAGGGAMSLPLPVPTLDAILLVPRRAALDTRSSAPAGCRGRLPSASTPGSAGSSTWISPSPKSASAETGDVVAVAHVEVDRDGHVTVVEVVGAEPADPMRVSLALLGAGAAASHRRRRGRASGCGAPSRRDDGDQGEAVRLWMCAERAYGDRLWLVASVRRP